MSVLQIAGWVVGPLMENTYLVYDEETREGIFIDPGDEAEALIEATERLNVRVTKIVNTHGHIDHIGAVEPLKRHFRIPFLIHRLDAELAENAPYSARVIGLSYNAEVPRVDGHLREGDTISVGDHKGQVIETPGHTAGGICIYFEDAKALFAGDTLFRGSIGRTDFPGGDYDTLIRSIREKLWLLPDDTVVYPGHGELTTIGLEKNYNPFVGVSRI